MNHQIIRHYALPLLKSVQKIEVELHQLEQNDLWRIKLDLNQNKSFYDAVFEFDKI